MGKVKITLVKSKSKRSPVQRATLTALGLRKSYQTIEKEVNPAIQGMIDQVKHLLKVENI
ncbi:MAG TPA: 50S ribosomal protein L30 [Bacteroidia bacterium]|jgi:large subunit ribosomal protein L30|nr:50S ribosomal protein L30 [Bacteroidia bacterium]